MDRSPHILVVDDDRDIRSLLARFLGDHGFRVSEAHDGRKAQQVLKTTKVDLVILDLMLPGEDGLTMCRRLRAEGGMPIVMLTALASDADRIVGLELGADDYVTKPFSPREVAARVKTVLRRARPAAPPVLRLSVGPLELDAARHEVRRGGEALSLTAKEFDLLWFLASNANRVFSRDQLMERVWGYTSALDTGTVTVHVRRLRTKIEDEPSEPRHLETVFGVGYRLTP